MRRLLFLFVCFLTSFATTGKADNFDESKVPPYTLPAPLVCDDGSPVRDIATWQQKRRAELLEHFARDVYGRTPTEPAKEMHWEATSEDRSALGGLAVRKEITIWFTRSKDGPKMHLLLFQPNEPRAAHSY